MAKSPLRRPQVLTFDNAQVINLLKFLRPITAKTIATTIDNQPINSLLQKLHGHPSETYSI